MTSEGLISCQQLTAVSISRTPPPLLAKVSIWFDTPPLMLTINCLMNIRHIVLLILDWLYMDKVSKEYSTFCSSREMSNLSNEDWTLHYKTFLYNLASKLKIRPLSSCFSKKIRTPFLGQISVPDRLYMSYILCPKHCFQTLVQPKAPW